MHQNRSTSKKEILFFLSNFLFVILSISHRVSGEKRPMTDWISTKDRKMINENEKRT